MSTRIGDHDFDHKAFILKCLAKVGSKKSPEQYEIDRATNEAVRWLSGRFVGSTLVEFIQRLPTQEAELVYATSKELKRLSSEEERLDNKEVQINVMAWCIGTATFAWLVYVLGRSLSELQMYAAFGLMAGSIWLIARRQLRKQRRSAMEAYARREELKTLVFQRIGVVYDEKSETVRSIARLKAVAEEVRAGVRDSKAVYEEICQGDARAREAGVNAELFKHRQYRLNPVLGGLPTEELLAHPDCAHLFKEMCKLGLRDHTVEAILLRRRGLNLPISAETYATAQSRMERRG